MQSNTPTAGPEPACPEAFQPLLAAAEDALARVKAEGDQVGLFVKVTVEGGGTYLQPFDQISNIIDGEFCDAEPGTKVTLEIVERTKREYDRLPEFDGH